MRRVVASRLPRGAASMRVTRSASTHHPPSSPSSQLTTSSSRTTVGKDATRPATGRSTRRAPRVRYSAEVQRQSLEAELAATQRELSATKLRLALLERGPTKEYEAVLRQLERVDWAALQAATELRYTAFALQCSHDNLELELRRLLAIGLTEGDVDTAAIEAGARRFIRANIGHRVEHVCDEPAVALDLGKAERTSASST